MVNQNFINPTRQIMLNNTIRRLWQQHIMWTRSFIISTVADLADLQPVTNRLLQNPVDFANVLRQFYSNEIADKFKDLFTQHLLIGADLVNAAKNGDEQMANEARNKWYANANDIAMFLASINPYWTTKEWQQLLFDHLKMTENLAILRINERYEDEIKQSDIIEEQALKMADYMINGIIKQFGI